MTKAVQLNIENKEKLCPICGEVMQIEEIGYCKECKADYNKNYYDENTDYFKDYYTEKIANKRFIYMMLSGGDDVIYIGSCVSKYRVKNHLQGNTHLKGLDWVQLGLNKLIYADVTSITNNNAERLFIEKMLIQIHKPFINDKDNEPDPYLEIEKIEKLVDLIYNNLIDYKEIDIKITLQDSKVKFNYSDLILV